MSPGLTGSTTKWKALTVATRAEWGSTTPFGIPEKRCVGYLPYTIFNLINGK